MMIQDYNRSPDSATDKIKTLKLRIVDLTEANDELEKENKKLKCSLELFSKFLRGEQE